MFKTSDFNFELPNELVAQKPFTPRYLTPMLIYQQDKIIDSKIDNLLEFLNKGDVLIFNNVKVIKAKLKAKNLSNQALININLDQQLSSEDSNKIRWLALCKPAKKLKEGDLISFSSPPNNEFIGLIVKKYDDGFIEIEFSLSQDKFLELLNIYGEMPLPPYIKNNEDAELNYQTSYANSGLGVAAPTAGLHFTKEMMERIVNYEIKVVFITLNVGAGTFLPVRAENIIDHEMHQESFTIDKESAKTINQAKVEKRRIVAVGTSSLRAVESACNQEGFVSAISGTTKIFIYPSYQFKIIDGLFTNFHLPKSTLFMLVSALIGKDQAHNLYQYAIAKKYRFYSFGDCSLLFK